MRTFMTSAVLATILTVMPMYAERGVPSEHVERAGQSIRLNVRDGSSQIVTLDGVGCDETICSRVAVNARSLGNVIANRTRFADIAAIRDISEGTATFVRQAIETRTALSPDALTGLEASLRFPLPETQSSRVFGRLSAWQNWIFVRPNAVGPSGALKIYGSGAPSKFDWNRV